MTEVICEREPTPVRAMRSTVVVSGVAEMRARGLFDRYVVQLSEEARPAIVDAIAGTWLPMAVALEHFAAVDALGLSAEEAFDIGVTSSQRFGSTLWGTLLRVARTAGADPWVPMRMYERLFHRTFEGGGFVVRKVGPKEAQIDYLSVPLSRFAYFRNATRGTHETILQPLANALTVREVPRSAHAHGFAMRVSWL